MCYYYRGTFIRGWIFWQFMVFYGGDVIGYQVMGYQVSIIFKLVNMK
jgi:hypothetical protein